ncbi:Homeodomain-like domain-containing protein [Novosphingobium sp. PhB57]|uniref:helix-turn-helix domain-containing protein n=1 Tax=Novosphingobium sp. PhB57 TaxID=2485107 RepID=UPI001049C115|nr:helix-turn-helix domain-containing protein [Novosphingobium sp. PhB57]TCU52344.1 Homeodomain-like domain-containing protein [Novosphingobium sp. PhB57]
MFDDYEIRQNLLDAEREESREIWLIAAPRMTRLSIILLRLRVGRGWSTDRICRRLHISRRTFRRHMGIAIRQIALALEQFDNRKG